jgi:hypothetical protein
MPSGVDKTSLLSSRRAFAGEYCIPPKQIREKALFSIGFCFEALQKSLPPQRGASQ